MSDGIKINGRIGATIKFIQTWWAGILSASFIVKAIAEALGAGRYLGWAIFFGAATIIWIFVKNSKNINDGHVTEISDAKQKIQTLEKVISEYRTDYHDLRTNTKAVCKTDIEFCKSLIRDKSVSPDLKEAARERITENVALVTALETKDHRELISLLYREK